MIVYGPVGKMIGLGAKNFSPLHLEFRRRWCVRHKSIVNAMIDPV